MNVFDIICRRVQRNRSPRGSGAGCRHAKAAGCGLSGGPRDVTVAGKAGEEDEEEHSDLASPQQESNHLETPTCYYSIR